MILNIKKSIELIYLARSRARTARTGGLFCSNCRVTCRTVPCISGFHPLWKVLLSSWLYKDILSSICLLLDLSSLFFAPRKPINEQKKVCIIHYCHPGRWCAWLQRCSPDAFWDMTAWRSRMFLAQYVVDPPGRGRLPFPGFHQEKWAAPGHLESSRLYGSALCSVVE